MGYFKIAYGVHKPLKTEYIIQDNKEIALAIAQSAARGLYDSFSGLYGMASEAEVAAAMFGSKYGSNDRGDMPDESTIFEHMTDEEIQQVGAIYRKERESNIVYVCTPISKEDYERFTL